MPQRFERLHDDLVRRGYRVVRRVGREHRLLDRSAVDALGACKFKPGVDESGKPVGAFANVEYVWKLD